MQSQPSMDDFRASSDNPIPVFLEKAISFIEKEGLDAEGLYRVPGNRAHVDLLFQKFDEGNIVCYARVPWQQYKFDEYTNGTVCHASSIIVIISLSDRNVDIHSLDIAVNAVATAVKDFVYNRLPEILPPEQMEDLEKLSSENLI